MTYEQFFFTLFSVVSFCLGWRLITDDGNLLYFIRKPWENLHDEIGKKKHLANIAHLAQNWDEWAKNKSDVFWLKVKLFFLKPTVLCISCMASYWGCVLFIGQNGFSLPLLKYIVIICISASFIQTFIWRLYERYL